MTFYEWIEQFSTTQNGEDALATLDIELGDGSEFQPWRPVFFYPDTPCYNDFKNMILASCFYAATCPPDPNLRADIKEVKLSMSETVSAIKNLRKVIHRQPEEFNWLGFYALLDLRNEGINITGGPARYDALIDKLLASIEHHAKTKNTPTKHKGFKAANLSFADTVKRKRKKPIRDGLIFHLAFLIRDWHGKKEACALGYGQPPQPDENSYPQIIAEMVSATLAEPTTSKQVTERLKALKKADAQLHSWPHEGEINT